MNEALDLVEDFQRRTQASPVVGVHGLQRPGLDYAAVQLVQLGEGAAGKLVGDLDVGGGDASHPVQHEVLAFGGEGGDRGDQVIHLDKGEFHLQRLLQGLLDVFGR